MEPFLIGHDVSSPVGFVICNVVNFLQNVYRENCKVTSAPQQQFLRQDQL